MSGWNYTASNKTSDGEYEVCPSGNHVAVCIGLVGLGTHERTYQGETERNPQVAIAWEIPGEVDSKGLPFIFAGRWNIPPNWGPKSALRKLLEAWRGRKFEDGETIDLGRIIGAPCMLQVNHKTSAKGNTVTEFGGIASLPKGVPAPAPTRNPFAWAFVPGRAPTVPDWFPWIYGTPVKDLIASAIENAGASAPTQYESSLYTPPETPRRQVRPAQVDEAAFAAATTEDRIPF